MRQTLAILRSTALEILSEPLTLLVLLAALVLTVAAPVFHYHQFGEVTRMARDAGLSALLTCGSVLAVFSTIRAFRREIESGTLEMALAHPVSRVGFFLSKTAGAFLAYLAVALILTAATAAAVVGASIGGRMAEANGGLPTVWGPCVAVGVAMILAPLLVGAALNRLARFRFVLTALIADLVFALVVLALLLTGLVPDSRWLAKLLPVVSLLTVLAAVFLSAAAAFAVRFAAHAAASLTGLVALAFLPFIGNYYLADALAKGGTVAWSSVALGTGAALPAIGGFLILGGWNVRRYNH